MLHFAADVMLNLFRADGTDGVRLSQCVFEIIRISRLVMMIGVA